MLYGARVPKENGGSSVSIVNRAYYSIFYAALALLVTVDTEPSKHTGVLATNYSLSKVYFPKK